MEVARMLHHAHFDAKGGRTKPLARQWRLASYVKPHTDMDADGRLYVEYPTFHADHEIGAYGPCTTWDVLTCLTAHEVAHAIHLAYRAPEGKAEPDHGPLWRDTYRAFRIHLGKVRSWDWNKAEVAARLGEVYANDLFGDGPTGLCDICGASYFVKRPMRRNSLGLSVCSPKCRAKAHRDKKKAQTNG